MAVNANSFFRRGRKMLADLEGQAARTVREGTAPHTKVAMRQLLGQYRTAASQGGHVPQLRDTGFRVFSQNDEDGIILFLLGVIGIGSGRFVDIGGGDGISASNCANLALNLGFHGAFIEGDRQLSEECHQFYGGHIDTKQYPPASVHAFVTRDNVNALISDAGIDGAIDVLSIDIDGNDYWIWDAISVVQPQIVVVETHTEYRRHDILAPYRADYDWRAAAGNGEPIGASATAGVRMAEHLGYRLVGGNRYGYNAFYVRAAVAEDAVPTATVDDLLRHPWNSEPNEWA